MLVGGHLGSRLGHRMKALGGFILVGIGFKILIEHLLE
jgi:putative Mn2+ efflux pump MntP